MQADNIFTAHPVNLDQMNALKAVVKAFKVKYEITNSNKVVEINSDKKAILKNISRGFKEVKQIENGEVKGTLLKDFLNEL
jgi:regulator of RNase E activity RraB